MGGASTYELGDLIILNENTAVADCCEKYHIKN